MTLTVRNNIYPVVDPTAADVSVTTAPSGDCDRVPISAAREGKTPFPSYTRAVRLSLRDITERKRRRLVGRLDRCRALLRHIVADLWPKHPTSETIGRRVDYKPYITEARHLDLNSAICQSMTTMARQLVFGTRRAADEVAATAPGLRAEAEKARAAAFKARPKSGRMTKKVRKLERKALVLERKAKAALIPPSLPSVDTLSLSFSHASFATHEDGKGIFDYVIRIPCWGLVLPLRRTSRLNYWLDKPGARLGASVNFLSGSPEITVSALIPVKKGWKDEGRVVGVDINMTQGGLSDSDGSLHQDAELAKTIRMIGSRGPVDRPRVPTETWKKRKARVADRRRRFFNEHRTSAHKASLRRRWKCQADRAVNLLPWDQIKVLIHEDLTGLKHGKTSSDSRSTDFRRRRSAWRYTHVIERLAARSQESRARLLAVNPYLTSVTCPRCGHAEKENRQGHTFYCRACGHSMHSGTAAAVNIKVRGDGILARPRRSGLASSPDGNSGGSCLPSVRRTKTHADGTGGLASGNPVLSDCQREVQVPGLTREVRGFTKGVEDNGDELRFDYPITELGTDQIAVRGIAASTGSFKDGCLNTGIVMTGEETAADVSVTTAPSGVSTPGS